MDLIKKFIGYIFSISDVDEAIEYEEIRIDIRGGTVNIQVRSQHDYHGIYLYNLYSYPIGDIQKIVEVLGLVKVERKTKVIDAGCGIMIEVDD